MINSLMLYIRKPPERIIDANTYKYGPQIQNPSSNGKERIIFKSVKKKKKLKVELSVVF